MKFTDMYIDKKLKPLQKMYQVRESEGFGIRVLPSGLRIFIFVYTIAGKRRQMNLGDYPDLSLSTARDRASEARKAFKAGQDPQEVGFEWHKNPEREKRDADRKAEADRNNISVEKLVLEYIEKHAKKFKRSWQEDERILNKEVLPLWGNRKAADIVKRDVVLLLEKIIERGSPGMSNNTFQVVRKMFNFAVERDILPYSPATGVKALAPKIERDRALSSDEIKTLWGRLDNAAISNEIKRALKLILVTAQRPGEVIGMHTSEINGHWWTIPPERSKNGKAHRVYLTETALDLIGPDTVINLKTGEESDKGYFFRCPHISKNKAIDPHAVAIAVNRNMAWPLEDQKGKPLYTKDGKQATENRLEVSKFTPHDLRRTAATFVSEMGFMDEIIDAMLNHAKQGVIKVYNQNKYDKEKQQALEAWERKLNGIITGEKGKVIPISSRKAV